MNEVKYWLDWHEQRDRAEAPGNTTRAPSTVVVELKEVARNVGYALEDCEEHKGDDAVETLRWCRDRLERLARELT